MGSPSDEDYRLEINSKSKFGVLISRIKSMEKHPEINMELNETLNTFLNQLNEDQQYLENGIFNVKFAEAGLFLQSAANLYSKKVDSLWDSTLQYQMQLCTYNKLAEAKAAETEKITQRLNRNKRRKVTIREADLNSSVYSDLTNICDKANNFLKGQCSLVHSLSNQNDFLTNDNSTDNQLPSSSSEENYNSNCVNGFCLSVDCTVRNQRTEEKLSNYKDLYLNCSTPYLEMCTDQNNEFQVTNHHQDLLLQKYLMVRHIPYKEFSEHQLGNEFEIFKQRNEVGFIEQDANPCSDNSVVTATTLLSQATECGRSDDNLVTTQELINKEKQLEVSGAIRKGSERISNADSLFHDEPYLSDTETENNENPQYKPQQSRADSGICCSDVPNLSTVMECTGEHLAEHLENSDYNANETLPCLDEPRQSECIDDASTIDIISEQIMQDTGISVDVPNENSSHRSQGRSDIQVPSTSIVHKTDITPMEHLQNDKKSLKRKLPKKERDEERKGKRRKHESRFECLKTSNALLHEFERFCKKHYQPEYGEGSISDIDNTSDEETDDLPDLLCLNDHDVENLDEHRELNTEVNEVAEKLQDDDATGRIRGIEMEILTTCENNGESTAQNNNLECAFLALDVSNVENNVDTVLRTSKNSMTENVSDHCINNTRNCEIETAERVRVVTEWKKFMEEKLLQAEKSSTFDIHQYGSFIMDSIPSENNLPFKDLANGKASAEVARLFLASLQLANTYNIELITAVPSQEVITNDTLQLKLLTKERYHEHLREFEAPSESAFRDNFARIQALKSAPLHSTPNKRRRLR